MPRLFWIALTIVLGIRAVSLQRKLSAEQRRGDMYRDISVRLDRQLAQLRQEQPA